MSDGTSLEDIETGNIQHTADDAYMNAILSDMNAVEEPVHQQPVYTPPPPPPPMQHMQHMQPMQQPDFQQFHPDFQFQQQQQQEQYQQQQQQQQQQEQYQQQQQQQEHYERVEEVPKKNTWYTLFEDLRDPLVVGLLVCLFSLPALHTWLSKRAAWAYKIGGSLSWLGFLLQFAVVAGLFATYRQIMAVVRV